MEHMGNTDSVYVIIDMYYSTEDEPVKGEMPAQPIDENDSLAWAIYEETSDSIRVKYKFELDVFNSEIQQESIATINQKLGRDISLNEYFKGRVGTTVRLQAVLLKSEIILLLEEDYITKVSFASRHSR